MPGEARTQESWKEMLAERMDPGWAEEIDQFEAQMKDLELQLEGARYDWEAADQNAKRIESVTPNS